MPTNSAFALSAEEKKITIMPTLPLSAQTQTPSSTASVLPSPQRASPPSGPGSTSAMLLTASSAESPLTASESRKLLSVNLIEKTSRRKNEPIGTPPLPS